MRDPHRGLGAWRTVSAVVHGAEREQVAALVGLEPESGADPGENLRRGADVAGLLEPGVPLGADPGGGGDLFPPEPGCAPAAALPAPCGKR